MLLSPHIISGKSIRGMVMIFSQQLFSYFIQAISQHSHGLTTGNSVYRLHVHTCNHQSIIGVDLDTFAMDSVQKQRLDESI